MQNGIVDAGKSIPNDITRAKMAFKKSFVGLFKCFSLVSRSLCLLCANCSVLLSSVKAFVDTNPEIFCLFNPFNNFIIKDNDLVKVSRLYIFYFYILL